MAEYLTIILPVVLALIVYFVRLESRLSKILTDLCWIKKELLKCPQSLEESSP